MHSYSQNDEDSFVLDLYKKKNIDNCFFFEFGAWDGIHYSNCRLLFENNWSGCFVELDKKKINDGMFKPITSEKVYSICKPIRVGFNNFGEYLFFYNHKFFF